MRRKIADIAIFVSLTSLLITGCSSNSRITPASTGSVYGNSAIKKPEIIRISWWGNQTRNDRTQKVLQMYNKSNPDEVFKGEFVDWNGYWNKLAKQSAANNLPDIIQMDYSYIKQYAEKNLLSDLHIYTSNGLLNLKNIRDYSISSGMVGGKLFGISLGINALVIYYDPAVFEEAGIQAPTANWTWKQYNEILTDIHEKTGKFSDPLFYVDPILVLEYMERQNGECLYSDDGEKLGFTDTTIIKGLFDQVSQMTNQGIYLSPDKVPVNAPLEDSPFVRGETFIGAGWSNQYAAILNAAGRPVEMVSLPLGGVYNGLYNKPSMFFSISNNSSYKNQCVKFIDYFINDINANNILLAERGVPTSSIIRDVLKSKVDQATSATFNYFDMINFEDKLVGAYISPAPAASNLVVELLKELYNQVAFEEIKPDDAALLFMKRANEILSGSK